MTKRLDSLYWEDTTKFTKTPEGYLTGRAVLTNVGVFPYLQEDGSVRWELRPEEEVFKSESMQSLANKPLTLDHPSELIDSKNVREVEVGTIGEMISRDEFHILGRVTVKDEAAVTAVESGEKAGLSCGYSVTVVQKPMTYEKIDWNGQVVKKTYPCPGVWMGVPYDAIQTDIVYNHVSLVPKGRAGDDARIRLDGARLDLKPPVTPTHSSEGSRNMKKLKLDNGLEYEVSPEVAVAFDALTSKNVGLVEELTQTKKALDSKMTEHKAALDAKDEELKALNEKLAGEPARLDAAVRARLTLTTTAAKAGVELKGDESELDIQKAVILAVSPKANLDGESAEYIGIRFKIACEHLDSAESNTDPLHDGPTRTPSKGEVKGDARTEARAAYIASLTNPDNKD